MTTTRICKAKRCGNSFVATDSRHEFCDSTCRANHHYDENPAKGRASGGDPLQSVAKHPLAEARAEQEATELKSHWSQVIYQGIINRLEHGPVHADDLESLFPENPDERAMCRKLVGAQFGSLASRSYIVSRERRKSKFKSRNAAKSGVYEFTKEGRKKLARHEHREGTAVSNNGTLDRPASQKESHTGARGSNVTANSPAGGSDSDLIRERASGRQLEDVPAGEAVASDGEQIGLLAEPDAASWERAA